MNGEKISQNSGERRQKAKKPIGETFRKVARQVQVSPEVLRGADRRWAITRKRTETVALLVRKHGCGAGEMAEYLSRDQRTSVRCYRVWRLLTGNEIDLCSDRDSAEKHRNASTRLSMNGKIPMISTAAPFVPSSGSGRALRFLEG